jgi:Cu2+-containing amine oxidase
MEDLQIVEMIVRKDPKCIEQCGIIGIPPEDMHKVYCDRMLDCTLTKLDFANNRIQHGQLATTNDLAHLSASNKL